MSICSDLVERSDTTRHSPSRNGLLLETASMVINMKNGECIGGAQMLANPEIASSCVHKKLVAQTVPTRRGFHVVLLAPHN